MAAELSDAEVFGSRELSDAEVFGTGQARRTLGQDVGAAATTAVSRLTSGVKADYRASLKSSGNPVADEADKLGRTARTVGDAVRVVTDPAAAAIDHAIVQPGAKLLSKIPAQAYSPLTPTGGGKPLSQDETQGLWANALNQGLSAIGPGKAGAPSAPRAPPVNALADNIARFDQAGVRPNLAAVKGGAASSIANTVAENPIAGFRARAHLSGQSQDVATSAERIAGQYGQPAARGAAGEAVQQGVGDFNQRFSKRAGRLYDAAFTPIERAEAQAVAAQGNQPIVEPVETQAALKGIANRVNAPSLSKIITNPKLQSIAEALTTDANAVRFGDLRALRTWTRTAQKDPELRGGISQGELQQLEGALTKDIYANAEGLAGPQAARRLRQTDQFYRMGSERIQGALQGFVGKGGSAPKSGESTYDLVLRAANDKGGADAARLVALKKSLQPHEWGDVAASTIDRMGKPTAGTAEGGDFSVGTFTTSYHALSDQGRNLLFGTGKLRQELDNLASVAGMVKRVQKGANVSRSAVSAQTVASIGGGAIVGWPLLVKSLALMGGAGEVVTNPGVVRWMSRLGAARSPGAVSQVVGQLRLAAQSNAGLLPFYQQVQLQLSGPKLAISAAATEPPQSGQATP